MSGADYRNTAGTYSIKYNVSDAAGNIADEVVRSVIVEAPTQPGDITPPVITLIGESEVTITVGDEYTDAGATAQDDKDGDISDDIEETGADYERNNAGTNSIKYNVSDAAGNDAVEVTRTVIVEAGDPVYPTGPPLKIESIVVDGQSVTITIEEPLWTTAIGMFKLTPRWSLVDPLVVTLFFLD